MEVDSKTQTADPAKTQYQFNTENFNSERYTRKKEVKKFTGEFAEDSLNNLNNATIDLPLKPSPNKKVTHLKLSLLHRN